jgi:hypothetical protein
MSDPKFEPIPGVSNLEIAKVVTTPNGNKFTAVMTETNIMLTSQTKPPHTIIVTGTLPTALSVGSVLGGLGDALGDALAGLLKFITCKPETSTVVETHKDGTCTVTMKTGCAPA